MIQHNSPQTPYVIKTDTVEENLQQFLDFDEFQQKNKIYQLQSTIHNLSIEKQQNRLKYKRLIEQQKNKLQQKILLNAQITKQNQQLREELYRLTHENQQLQKQNLNKHQQIGNISPIYKLYQHRNSFGSQMVKQLQNKNQIIYRRQKSLQWLKQQNGELMKSQSYSKLNNIRQQQFKTIKKQLQQAIIKIEAYRRNQAQLKKRYDQDLTHKQEIISKLTLHNDEHSKNLLYSRQKMNIDLKRQIQQLLETIDDNKQQINSLNNKNNNLQVQLAKLKRQLSKKDHLQYRQCETQKQQMIKQYDKRMKSYVHERQDKIQTLQQEKNSLESQIDDLKAEQHKYKTKISSMNQLIQFFEKVNKQQDSNKKKLQQAINQKNRQIGIVKQESFRQINELKIIISNLKKQHQQKIKDCQQELKQKNTVIEKLRNKMKITGRQSRLSSSYNNQVHRSIDSLKFENAQLKDNANRWALKYQDKCQQAQLTQLKLQKKYQDQLIRLQMEIKDQKLKNLEMKQTQASYDQQIRKEIDKVRISKQQLDLENTAKIQEIKILRRKLIAAQKKLNNLEKQNKLMKQDYQKKYAQNLSKHQDAGFQDQSYRVNQNLQTEVTKQFNSMNQIALMKKKQVKAQQREFIYKKQLQEQKHEIQRLNQIIQKLSQKSSLKSSKKKKPEVNNNINIHPAQQKLQSQNLKLRVQFSQTLKQLNILLQKHKNLEQIHKQCSNTEQNSKSRMQLTIERNHKPTKLNVYTISTQINPTQRRDAIKPSNMQPPKVSEFSYKKQQILKSPLFKTSITTEKQKSFESYKQNKKQQQLNISLK